MLRYIVVRLVAAIAVVWAVATAVFFMGRLSGGDPAVLLAGTLASAEDLARVRAEYGLDRPLHVQYWRWMTRAAHGDLGRSLTVRRLVLPEVLRKFRNTLILGGSSLLLAVSIGPLLGIMAAVRANSWIDHFARLIATVGISMPAYWLGLMLIIAFTVRLKLVPGTGMYSPGLDREFKDLFVHLVLPSVTLAMVPLAVMTRMTRAAMMEVLSQNYITVARAKGLSERVVITRHAIRNALVMIITVVGIQTGYVLGGSALVETVFGWPGIGQMLVTAILGRDLPLVQGGVLVVASTYVMLNLLVDLMYVYLDPRIKYA